MKKICIALLLLTMLALTGCGAQDQANRQIKTTAGVEDILQAQIDASFNKNASKLTPSPTNADVTPTETQAEPETVDYAEADVDLTGLPDTLLYSEVYTLCDNPNEYMGKTIKMTGTFSTLQDSETGNIYYLCLVMDATACCAQGMEFILRDGRYPEEGSTITVMGTYSTYYEGTSMYCTLKDAVLLG